MKRYAVIRFSDHVLISADTAPVPEGAIDCKALCGIETAFRIAKLMAGWYKELGNTPGEEAWHE